MLATQTLSDAAARGRARGLRAGWDDRGARAPAHLRVRRAHGPSRDPGARRACPRPPRRCRPSCAPATRGRAVRRARRGHGALGRALPVAGGVVISLARMRRILEIDLDGGRVIVEPGVANLDVTRAVAPHGYYYAPDPSSQQVCTIGGNVAENSGGAHCLKYGFTVNHVCGLAVVLPDGELVELGGEGARRAGPRPARRLRRLGGDARHRGARSRCASSGAPEADHDVHGVVRLDRRGRRRRLATSSPRASSRPRSR